MASRSAESTIKGYFYQFDNSILEILKLANETDSITIEGIEDIDINSVDGYTAIQCKYYEGTEYNHSVIAEPLRLMLNHFSDYKKGIKPKVKYILRGHYKSGQHKLNLPIDLSLFKEKFLTYTSKKITYEHHKTLSLGDLELKEFLDCLIIDINAKNFNDQLEDLIDTIKDLFSCNKYSAENFYYNNCLKLIKNLSIERELSKRTISKKDFINKIDTSKVLFNEWFIIYKTKKEYLKTITQNLKSTRVLEVSKSKIVLIGNDILKNDNSELPIDEFILNLISKFYKINSAFRDAKPLSLVLDCDESEIKRIKEYLIENHIVFHDGYEHIKFSYTIFNTNPIITKSKNGTKIINSSYFIKLISKKTFDNNFIKINAPTAFINFSKYDIINTFPTGQFFDFKYCETLKDIHQVLTK
ncbi:DUF4297 family anti-phage-associated protein [Myroides odoratimimus]|uniref:DUF4297 family anti-phage-associated protein n=1 Tax=Myroides odoratimimus TaxID=76832 RepID=UPI0029C02E7F|nr:DUF4297 family anti-phage-associated protein [Myroides odoratimimus]MDX4972131.1 DUF4297 family anti-phage-associated protein [Myroides odoratimimus]